MTDKIEFALNEIEEVVNNDGHIEISREIKKFNEHLSLNDRVIFSAKYGDGKTYFLNQFKDEYKDQYLFLTIYPVNYQVADSNKDVFELIKRDILVQLCINKIIQDDNIISDDVINYFCMLNNLGEIVSDCIDFASSLPIPGTSIFKGVSTLLKLRKKYQDKRKSLESKSVDAIISKLNNNTMLYSHDYVSELITKSIEQYHKNEKGKKIVLIIEDLDRIDPAHIFRILNIFSAHIDRGYINGYKDESNKYGIHKIITVCDYNNIENIFKHLYGAETDFNGYIKKFSTINHFEYSISSLAIANFSNSLERIIGFRIDVVRLLGSIAGKENFTIREMSTVIYKIGCNIKEEKVIFSTDHYFVFISINPLTMLLSLFSLLNIKESDWFDLFSIAIPDIVERIKVLSSFLVFTGLKDQILDKRFKIDINDGFSVYECDIRYENHFADESDAYAISAISIVKLKSYTSYPSFDYREAITAASKYIHQC